MSPRRATLFLAVFLGLFAGARAQTYILGSPDGALNTEAWALSAANLSGFRGAITNPAYFGTGGVVSTAIVLRDLPTVSANDLAALNGLFVPWWNNSQSTPYVSAIVSAFQGGMDLWLLEDDSGHNAIGTALGIVASNADGTVSNGGAPFFSGPFGTATNTATFGNFAQFDATTIATLGGTVIGRNASNQVTAVYWAKGQFAPGAGALVLFSDVDMISNWTQNPYSPTLTANGILALNTTAALVQAVPEPGTWVLFGLGGALLIGAAWRRRNLTSR